MFQVFACTKFCTAAEWWKFLAVSFFMESTASDVSLSSAMEDRKYNLIFFNSEMLRSPLSTVKDSIREYSQDVESDK
jgi:hypothetical protein